jgi:hypothetical protein
MLFVQLAEEGQNPRLHEDALKRVGCNEGAHICYGIKGHLAFEFRREGKTRSAAQNYAWKQVRMAIPDATLLDLDKEVD